MASADTTKNDVIFLFGAGASIDAGIPGTYEFVKDFEAHIKEKYPELSDPLSEILKICEEYNIKNAASEKPKPVDVEQLLDILRRLINQKKDTLLYFYEKNACRLTFEEKTFSDLQKLLEDFIREKVIAEKEKLEYLQELFKFDTPLEIYSTNYDTCIEQLSYLNHRSYTDGFDVTWNEKNFENYHDIKHYKLHGSIIWYQNKKTKECVKIPVRAFSDDGKPVPLKLIYGEDVAPLLIYPAQKSDYIEPLTDLQLMFKKRLFKDTKIIVIVGYSFRDNYIVHMLWDAARVNEDLHIVLIAPNAKEIFDSKLKFIDKDSPSRIHDRVICLPYPFSTVIYELKNHYLRILSALCKTEKEIVDMEKRGQNVDNDWQRMLGMAIDCGFLTKAESILKRLEKDWDKIDFGGLEPVACLHYALRGWLSAIATEDVNENKWLERMNKSIYMFHVENLRVTRAGLRGVGIAFQYYTERRDQIDLGPHQIMDYWIDGALSERKQKLILLGQAAEIKLKRANEIFDKLEKFRQYISVWRNNVDWKQYQELRSKDKDAKKLASLLLEGIKPLEEIGKIVLDIERRTLKEAFGGDVLHFGPLPEKL